MTDHTTLYGFYLASFVDIWRGRFVRGPHLQVRHDLGSNTIVLEWSAGFGFLPAVWMQLAQTVVGLRGVYTCDGCGETFTRARQPQAGRRAYCQRCGKDKKGPKRDWARRARAPEVEPPSSGDGHDG